MKPSRARRWPLAQSRRRLGSGQVVRKKFGSCYATLIKQCGKIIFHGPAKSESSPRRSRLANRIGECNPPFMLIFGLVSNHRRLILDTRLHRLCYNLLNFFRHRGFAPFALALFSRAVVKCRTFVWR